MNAIPFIIVLNTLQTSSLSANKIVLALSFCFGATALLLTPFFTNAVVLGVLAAQGQETRKGLS